MLELIVITISLFILFALAAWYAHYVSKKRSKLLNFDDSPSEPFPAKPEHEFGHLFQKELKQPTQDGDTLDSDPQVNISETARIHSEENNEAKPIAPSDQTNSEVKEIKSAAINVVEPELTIEQLNESPITINQKETVGEALISLTVVAKAQHSFSGRDIKVVLEGLNLSYGEFQIYHYILTDKQQRSIFSVANMLAPGTLEPEELVELTTKGLVLFTQLSGPLNALTVFEEMLGTAHKIADELDGEVCDENRQQLNEASLEAIRSQILKFNLTEQQEQNQFKYDYTS